MSRAAVVALVAACASAAQAAQAARPQLDLRCESHGSGPLLDCVLLLRDAAGAPIRDATVTLGAAMPSMPMAHSIKPAAAAPTAVPGEYRARLELEMAGIWALQVDLARPRERLVRTLEVADCAKGRRCAARPARMQP